MARTNSRLGRTIVSTAIAVSLAGSAACVVAESASATPALATKPAGKFVSVASAASPASWLESFIDEWYDSIYSYGAGAVFTDFHWPFPLPPGKTKPPKPTGHPYPPKPPHPGHGHGHGHDDFPTAPPT